MFGRSPKCKSSKQSSEMASTDTAQKAVVKGHQHSLRRFRLTRLQKLYAVTIISTIFSIVEIVLGFRQRSLVLIADAFHVTSDLFGFIIAIVAVHLSESDKPKPGEPSA